MEPFVIGKPVCAVVRGGDRVPVHCLEGMQGDVDGRLDVAVWQPLALVYLVAEVIVGLGHVSRSRVDDDAALTFHLV